MPVNEITDSIQEQVLDALHFAQETAVDAVKSWAGTVQPYVPQLFPLAEKVLESQKQFIVDLLDAVKPVVAAASTPDAATA
jgi:uncharacterized protein (DUF2342 family)